MVDLDVVVPAVDLDLVEMTQFAGIDEFTGMRHGRVERGKRAPLGGIGIRRQPVELPHAIIASIAAGTSPFSRSYSRRARRCTARQKRRSLASVSLSGLPL